MKEGPSEVIGTALESTRLARGAQPQVETTSCTNQREIYNKLLLFATTYFEPYSDRNHGLSALGGANPIDCFR